MKTIQPIVASVVLTLASALSVQAAEPLLTPHLQQLHYGLPRVAVSPDEPDLTANLVFGNAKQQDIAQSIRIVPDTDLDIDLANAPRPSLRAKDPYYDAALFVNAEQKYQDDNRQGTVAAKDSSGHVLSKTSR